MRPTFPAMLCLLVTLAGCKTLDREQLVAQYEQTALAEGVRSTIPLPHEPFDPDSPPTVVNWWYAGSRLGTHYVVVQELQWDASGRSQNRERWLRVSGEALQIDQPFDKTRDPRRWVPLYEAAPDTIPPPPDLVTRRVPLRPKPLPTEQAGSEPQRRDSEPGPLPEALRSEREPR